jgi:hypothetical protein
MTALVVAKIRPADKRTPNDVLEYSKDKLSECVVLGTDINGNAYIIGCDESGGTLGALWLIESVKLALLRGEVKPF